MIIRGLDWSDQPRPWRIVVRNLSFIGSHIRSDSDPLLLITPLLIDSYIMTMTEMVSVIYI